MSLTAAALITALLTQTGNELSTYIIRQSLTPGCSSDVEVSEEFTGPGSYRRASAACEAKRSGVSKSYCAIKHEKSKGPLHTVVVSIERDCEGWPGVVVHSYGVGFGPDQDSARTNAVKELGFRDWGFKPRRHKVEDVRGFSLTATLQASCAGDGGLVTFETRGGADGGVPSVLIGRSASGGSVIINLTTLDGGIDAAAIRARVDTELCSIPSVDWGGWLLGRAVKALDPGRGDGGTRTKNTGPGVRN